MDAKDLKLKENITMSVREYYDNVIPYSHRKGFIKLSWQALNLSEQSLNNRIYGRTTFKVPELRLLEHTHNLRPGFFTI